MRADIFKEAFNSRLKQENQRFFGRENLLSLLESKYQQADYWGWHIGIYGVRRSGKTTLVRHFIHSKINELKQEGDFFFLSIVGDHEKTTKENAELALNKLNLELEKKLRNPDYIRLSSSSALSTLEPWERFFQSLLLGIECLQKESSPRLFFFFDEIAWLSKDGSFLRAYSDYLNQSKVDLSSSLNFLACSSNSWLRSNVFKNTKGLYNRFLKMEVSPFNFKEIYDLFVQKHWHTDKEEVLKYYLMFGGFVKYYLEFPLDFSLSFEHNFSLLLKEKRYFEEEYEAFFKGVFSERKKFRQIIELILQKKTVDAKDLEAFCFSQSISMKTLKEQLLELKKSGVIQQCKGLDREVYYCRLPLLYFFHYFQSEKNVLDKDNLYKWRGEMFELFALENIEYFQKELGDYCFIPNFKVRDSDFGGETDRILGQFDLVGVKQSKNYNKNRTQEFVILEVKFQSSPISTAQREKLQSRAKAFETFIEERKEQKKETGKTIVRTNFITIQDELNLLSKF